MRNDDDRGDQGGGGDGRDGGRWWEVFIEHLSRTDTASCPPVSDLAFIHSDRDVNAASRQSLKLP